MNQEINRQNSVRKIRDRYKPLFCDKDFYKKNQKHFAILATNFVTTENSGPDEIEKFIVTTLILSLLRRPLNWFGGFRENAVSNPYFSSENPDFLTGAKFKPFTDSVGVKWSSSINPEISVYEFLNSVKIKSIPEKVFWALNFLSQNKNRFLVSNGTPTPYELLSIQATGKRVITFESDHSLWPELIYEHRDVLSFWLHDLIHAAEFFQNEDHKNLQISFYRWIELLTTDSSRNGFMTTFLDDQKNRLRFEYLISDMNSHPLHLIKTFRAILDEANPNFWHQVVYGSKDLKLNSRKNYPDFDQNTEALLKVNSRDFSSYHYDALLHFLSCINEIWALSNKTHN